MEDRLDDMIIEMAHHLGDTIKRDRRFVRYDAAHKAFSGAPELTRMMTEYSAQQAALVSVQGKPDVDDELTSAIEGRINTLYLEITENEIYKEFVDAKAELDELIKGVNDEIYFALTGEAPHSHEGGCSGDCSACGGGCGVADEHIYD